MVVELNDRSTREAGLRAERGAPIKRFFLDRDGSALPQEQMPFEATRLAGGLERKRQNEGETAHVPSPPHQVHETFSQGI